MRHSQGFLKPPPTRFDCPTSGYNVVAREGRPRPARTLKTEDQVARRSEFSTTSKSRATPAAQVRSPERSTAVTVSEPERDAERRSSSCIVRAVRLERSSVANRRSRYRTTQRDSQGVAPQREAHGIVTRTALRVQEEDSSCVCSFPTDVPANGTGPGRKVRGTRWEGCRESSGRVSPWRHGLAWSGYDHESGKPSQTSEARVHGWVVIGT